MICNCDACDRQNVPVSKVNTAGEPLACFICQGDTNPDPYGELPQLPGHDETMGNLDALKVRR